MDRYYVATKDGNTEGPFSRHDLLIKYSRGELMTESLVCAENGKEWEQFGSVFKKGEEGSQAAENKDSNSQIAGAFRGVGIVCFVLAVIVPLVLLAGGSGQVTFAAAIFLVLALSGLGWLGVGVIIRLLEQIAENTGRK